MPENVTLTVEGSLTVDGAIRVETGGSITGAENISGKVQHKLTKDMVEIEADSYTYTGQAITPTVTIDGCNQGTDYTVDYADNINAGEATITITPTKGGKLYGEAVTMNFTIEKETPDYTEPQITYYDIHFVQPNDSVRFDYRGDQVREGNTFSFSASVAEGYDPKTLVVEYRRGPVGIWREAALDSDGKYHIRANYADLYIRARVEPLNPTGVESVGDDAIEVYAEGGAISVYTPNKERVAIVSMSGAVIRMEEQVGTHRYTNLPDGVYIVQIGERSYKVRL